MQKDKREPHPNSNLGKVGQELNTYEAMIKAS
jgi:hypothetical protein